MSGITPIYGNFDLRIARALDGKTVKETLADRNAMDFAYAGMPCWVIETGKLYLLTKLPASEDGNWIELGSDPSSLLFDSDRPITKMIGVGTVIGGKTVQDFLGYFYDFVGASMSIGAPPLYEKGLVGGVTVNLSISVNAKSETDFSNGIVMEGGNTVATFDAGGGTRYATPILNVAAPTSYTAYMDVGNNGSPTTLMASRSVSFAAPTYHGTGPAGLSEIQLKALTKRIRGKASDNNLSFSPTLERFYYAYPASYGAVKKVIDPNNFDVTDGFVSIPMEFTLPDGAKENYTVLMGTSDTTQANFQLDFIF